MSISIRLEELRREAGLSKAKTAKALGLSYTTYIGYESGEREPKYERLIEIADFFGVSVDYLLGHTNARNFQGGRRAGNDFVITLRCGEQISGHDVRKMMKMMLVFLKENGYSWNAASDIVDIITLGVMIAARVSAAKDEGKE